ncbi:hypothetical protein [Ferrimicrobium sp.]|uniref:hypothetical protein n=1 Tax=Ferrimicrobium sp. TaxID=2926050 RepID=UPI002614E5C0|nr:hypothetical protein [Ferrimicrobium sp.]
MRVIWERLRTEDRVLSVCVVAIAITLFLPWHTYAILSITGTTDGFHSWGFLTALGVLLLAFVLTSDGEFFTRHTPRISLGSWRVIGAALMFGGAALYLTIGPGSYHSTEVPVAYGPSYGVYLAFLIGLAALLLTFRQGRKSIS